MLKFSLCISVAFCCLLIISSGAFAGNLFSIKGKIIDNSQQPVIAATVALLNASDSSLAKVTASEDDGTFELEISPGKYLLKISVVGFETYSAPVNVTSNDVLLGEIKLSSGSVDLKEVTVTAEKPMIEVKPDKTVFNVENSINAQGSNVLELLQKSPGVVVDQNNNISLKGRGSVQVQIDGRPTQLSGDDLADLLKSMQASDVSTIDLISNPSAKYEAEGTAGIINIRLKKNKSFGTNGSVTAGYAIGTYSKYNTSLNLNNRNKVVNIFGNYSNNWGNRLNHLNLYRIQNDTIYDQLSSSIYSGLRNNFKAGADFFLNSKNTAGVLVTGNLADFNGNTSSHTNISGEGSDEITKVLTANNVVDGHFNNLDFNGNYRFADTSGHELNVDADYGLFRNNRDANQPNTYTNPDGLVLDEKIYRTISPTSINIYTLKSDYSQNFLKGKLGAGFKFSYVRTDNTFNFYNVIDGEDVLDETRSNQFVYTENINALYLQYERQLNGWDLEAGLRAEQTNSNGDLTSTISVENENVKRSYLDLFPSAGITYNLNKKNSLGLNYSRRIDRPNYQELNPFEYKLDELTYRKGNPFLNPQYTDKVELSHTYNYSVTTSIGYSFTRDFFAQYTDTTEGNRSFLTTRNLANEEIVSLDLSAPFNIKKWWNVFFNGSIYNVHYAVNLGDGNTPDVRMWSYNFYVQNTFKLPKGISIELSGWYSGPSIWGGTFESVSQGSMDVGVQKKLFKDKGNLKLAATDIFHTLPWSSVNAYGNLYLHAYGDWESRQFRATFTYRFGNSQVKGARQRQTGNETEQQRVGDQQQ